MMIRQEIVFTSQTNDVRVSRETSKRLTQWQTQTLQRLQQEPGKPKYPIRWTSERQRRAFFATRGFDRGIPTRRTHALSQGWQVDVNIQQVNRLEAFTAEVIKFLANFGIGQVPIPPAPDVIVSVDNPVSYERFVTGSNQQGFHKDTGWFNSADVLDTAFQDVEGILSGL